MKKTVILVLCTVLAVAAAGIYLVKMKARNGNKGIEALYDFSPVQRMDLSEKIEDAGTVVLAKNMDIYPAYEVTVRQINVKTGDQVQKGQLLMVLESPAMKAQWADANSTYRQAVINLDQARKVLQRTKVLYDAQGATIDDLETAQNKVDLYQEQVNNARVKLDQITNIPDDANFMAADHYTLLIKAPFSGTVAWVYSRTGDKVEPQAVQNSQTAKAITPMLSLTEKDSLQVEITVDQSEIAMVRLGQKAVVTASDENQTKLDGVVTGVGSVGTNTAGVITYPVRISILKDPNQVLLNGMTVDGTIIISEHPNVLAVPSGALVERRGHTMVGVRQGNNVVFVRVETGVTSNSFTEITSGLKDGDLVAVAKPVVPKNNDNRRGRGMMMFH
ncbi:MAG: efflux RND transporter periplasmic adaptor subunit [Bacillota bacterium]